jgi:hypothetical protein
MGYLVAGAILYVVGLVAYPLALRRWWTGRRVPFNARMAPKLRQQVLVNATGVVGGVWMGIGLVSIGAWSTSGPFALLSSLLFLGPLVAYWEAWRYVHNRQVQRGAPIAMAAHP